MDRMIKVNDNTINRQVGNEQNKGVVFRWETHKFRSVEISGRRSQCLQFCLNAFYHDVNDLKKATILWSVAHWGQRAVCRTNDNAFIFNSMLGCNTVFYDNVDSKWTFDRVNDLSATCYIKYSNKHYTYIQPLSSHIEDKDFFHSWKR